VAKKVNAGLQSVEEAMERLMKGEVFYYYGSKMFYDSSFVLKGESPYRFMSVSIIQSWYFVKDWKREE